MIAFLLLVAAQPVCPDKTGNQGEINACAERDLQRAEARLDVQWKHTFNLAEAQDSPGETYSVDTLNASQVAWRAYREAECRLESAPIGYMGTLDRYLYLSCLAGMAEKRIDDLKNLEKAYRD